MVDDLDLGSGTPGRKSAKLGPLLIPEIELPYPTLSNLWGPDAI